MRSRQEREAAQDACTRRRWLTLHADHYERTCPVCFAIPGMFCVDEEDGQEVYVVHRERLPSGVSFKLRTRLIRALDGDTEEEPCSGGS